MPTRVIFFLTTCRLATIHPLQTTTDDKQRDRQTDNSYQKLDHYVNKSTKNKLGLYVNTKTGNL